MLKWFIRTLFILSAIIFIGGFSPIVHADEVKTKEIYTLEDPTWLRNAGMTKGISHDKQSLGIIIPANVKLEVRQTNPKFTDDLQVEMVGDGTKKNFAYVTSEWETLQNTVDLVPFVRTPYTKEKPILEYRVTDEMTPLPIYEQGDNQEVFFNKWDTENSSYALLTSDYVQFLVPKKDKEYLKNMDDFSSIDNLFDYYTDIFETLNQVTGLSFTPENPTDKNIPNKYFVQANINGYKGSSAAYTTDSTYATADSIADIWLSKKEPMIALHEIGHGYQGAFLDPMISMIANPYFSGFNVNEVWNNQYVTIYEKKLFGDDVYTKGYFYEGAGKARSDAAIDKLWQQDHVPLDNWGPLEKLEMLVALNEKTNDKGLTHFYQEYRKLANQPGFIAKNNLLLDQISKYYGEVSGFDFTPALVSAGGRISQAQQTENYYKKGKPVTALSELVTAEKLPDVQKQLNIPSPFKLVDTDQLASTNLTGTARLNLSIDDIAQIKNKIIVIRNGNKIVRQVGITGSSVYLGELPVGIYSLDMPTGNTTKYSVDTQYLRVKNETTTIPVKYMPKKTSDLTNQTMHLTGINNSEVETMSVDLNNEKLSIDTIYETPNKALGDKLFSKIEVLNLDNQVVFSKEANGNSSMKRGIQTCEIKEGYKIRVYHNMSISVDNLTILDPSNTTHTFTVTKLGLQQDGTKVNASTLLTPLISSAAQTLRNNETMLNSPYVALKNDLLLAIQLLDEPAQSSLLTEYKDVLPTTTLDPKSHVTAPTLNDIYVDDTIITGSQPTGTVCTLTVFQLDGTYRLYGYPVDDTSNISMPLNQYSIKLVEGMRVDLTYKLYGVTSLAATQIVKTDKPTALTVDATKIAAYTGENGKLNTTVKPAKANQEVLYTTSNPSIISIDEDGNWKALKQGSATITVTSKKNTSVTQTIPVTVSEPAQIYTLTANNYTFGDVALKGTFSKNIAKVRLWVNGMVVTQATTNADGTFSFNNAASFITKSTDKIEIVGVDAAYVEKKRITIPMKAVPATGNELTVGSYTIDSSTLSGTFGKNIFKVRLWVNGKVATQAISNADGSYSFANVASFIKAGDKVEIVGVDKQYQEVNRISVKLTDTEPLNNTFTIAPFNLGDKTITGAFGSDISKIRLWVNGKVAQQATTTNGSYTFTSANYLITNATDLVEIVAVDAQYKELSRKTIRLK
ncbi:immunoglobulin-like domain-containing protein [Listeria rustica]|uniref:Peptidase M60 domain-containing protein n=1 Tax=Listeria rustica TaxID=2713503 RepID=A0A7W1T7Q6_9LIST|nr:immunoglobulin-like domain-containing protein [Listeria rustica]MBA3927037.1 hypothetical protein [Listeria rustica]